MTEQTLPSVNDLDLPFFDYNEPGLVGEPLVVQLADQARLVVVEERQVQVVDRVQRLLRHFLASLAGR